MKAPTSYQAPDGRWFHTFRQSDINRSRKCPEQHRRHMIGLDPDRTSLAMLVGTAVHAGIEAALNFASFGTELGVEDQVDRALASFEHEYWEASYRGTLDTTARLKEDPELAVRTCTLAWHDDVLPWMRRTTGFSGEVEHQFTVPFHEDAERVVLLQGTADYVAGDVILDWKTGSGSGSYQRDAWKYRRGYETSQHVVYSAAMAVVDGYDPTVDAHALRSFRFVKLSRSGHETDVLDLQVQPADVRFLRLECLSLARLIESRSASWPLGPTGWWCSPLWCTAWDSCRGATGGMQS